MIFKICCHFAQSDAPKVVFVSDHTKWLYQYACRFCPIYQICLSHRRWKTNRSRGLVSNALYVVIVLWLLHVGSSLNLMSVSQVAIPKYWLTSIYTRKVPVMCLTWASILRGGRGNVEGSQSRILNTFDWPTDIYLDSILLIREDTTNKGCFKVGASVTRTKTALCPNIDQYFWVWQPSPSTANSETTIAVAKKSPLTFSSLRNIGDCINQNLSCDVFWVHIFSFDWFGTLCYAYVCRL